MRERRPGLLRVFFVWRMGWLVMLRRSGEGVSELRIDYGPGYRVYFRRRGNTMVVLLCGGDKRTQARDIAKARELAKERSNDHE